MSGSPRSPNNAQYGPVDQHSPAMREDPALPAHPVRSRPNGPRVSIATGRAEPKAKRHPWKRNPPPIPRSPERATEQARHSQRRARRRIPNSLRIARLAFGAPVVLACIGSENAAEIEMADDIGMEAHQMIFREPVVERGRDQQRLVKRASSKSPHSREWTLRQQPLPRPSASCAILFPTRS